MKALIIIPLLLLVTLFPASSGASPKDVEFGGFTAGPVIPAASMRPWLYGTNPSPPIGCRSAEGWSTGHAPVGGYTAYRFHMRVTWCWSSDSWVDPGYQLISGRHFTSLRVRTWWTDPKNVRYDEHVQLTTSKYDCWVDSKTVHDGCFYVRAVGQVDHAAVPLVHFVGITAHPWVKIVVRCDGEWLSGDYDRSVI